MLFSDKNRYTATFGAVLALGVYGMALAVAVYPAEGGYPLVGKLAICSIIFPFVWILVKIGFIARVEVYEDRLVIKGVFVQHSIPFSCLREIGPPSDLYFRTDGGDYWSLLLGNSIVGELFGNKTNKRVRRSIQSKVEEHRLRASDGGMGKVRTRPYFNLQTAGGLYMALVLASFVSEILIYS